jgi:hypothetical protein
MIYRWLPPDRARNGHALGLEGICGGAWFDAGIRVLPPALSACLSYAHRMTIGLWVGAVVTLAGAALGGAISFVLSRQQIKDARAQRAEQYLHERQRHSADRRFDAYSDFLTKARSFRDAIRGYDKEPDPAFGPKEIDAIARSAHSASALVFLVVESTETYDVCRAVVSGMKYIQRFLPDFGSRPGVPEDDPWPELNDRMARLLREFQVAAREELEIGGVDPSVIMDQNRPQPTMLAQRTTTGLPGI